MHRDDRTNTAQRFGAWCVLVVFALHLPGTPAAFAAPSGEDVVHGEATFTRDGNETLIETGTNETIVDYDSFDILADEIVRIDQPNEDSRILNRIPFGGSTHIDGSLLSNGIVYILNPAGVFAGDTAIIDVNALVAAAGDLSNEDFLAGNDLFTLSGDVIVAEGAQIAATDSVALLGRRVANFGSILAQGGYVAFVAGDRAVLAKLDGRLAIRVDGGDSELDDFALTQAGTVEGPRVSLTAGDTYSLAMNHTGVTRGREIELRAGNEGLVQVAGELDASAQADETGGRIHVLGDKIAVLTATLDASGPSGGGEIRVGGDVRGQGELPTARRLYIAPDAVLRADAIETGDGGSIVAWSEEKTGFFGTASATGGGISGDGGFIEISGRQSLEARGHTVDLSAANGASGKLLYDPDEIVILGGGPTDGSDTGDDPVALEGGVLGRILEGDVGTLADPADPFEIYESELEGTDADIELVATSRIETSGAFDDSDVVIMAGNDLTIRTTGQGPETGDQIDLTAGGNEGLRWVVSEGGTIFINTTSGETDGTGADGNIRVGELEFGGREFGDPTPGIFTPIGTSRAPIAVSARQGDIFILGSVIADGGDAEFTPAVGDEGPVFRTPESGGNISIGALSGSVEIDGSISSRGGSAIPETPSVGGDGGFVFISSENGSVAVRGGIDVSAGDGQAGSLESEGEDIPLTGFGGRGGAIFLNGAGIAGGESVVVEGDLLASGGNAAGFIFEPAIGGLSPTNGGQGGQVAIQGDTIEISNSRIDVSGGHGPVEGGDAINRTRDDDDFQDLEREGNFSLPPVAVSILANEGNVELDGVDIDASGGASGTETDPGDPGATVLAGPGGKGGTGGDVEIESLAGSVLGSTLTISNNGGVGNTQGTGPDAPLGIGGSARNVRVTANNEIELGDIQARGGAAHDGDAGDGGIVGISSGDRLESGEGTGNITISNIDTSGGDVLSTAGDFDGGRAGTITVNALADAGVAESVVTLQGGLGGLGGAASGEGMNGEGAPVVVRSTNGSIVTGAAGAGVASRATELTAVTVGESGNPVRVSGTSAEDDRATISVAGESYVEVVPGIFAGETEIAGALESLRLEHGAVGEDLDALFTQGGNTLIDIDGRDNGPLIVKMGNRDDDEPTLEYGLFVGDDVLQPVEIARGAVDLGARGGSITSLGSIVGGAGSGTHVETNGDFVLEGDAIGSDALPIELRGDADAALRFIAEGDVDAEIVSESFGAYAVVQENAEGTTDVFGMDVIDIAPEAGFDPDAAVSQINDVDTNGSFAYELASGGDGDPSGDAIRITRMRVGDDADDAARVVAPGGDILIDAPTVGTATIVLAGGHLALESLPPSSGGSIVAAALGAGEAHIDMGGGDEGELLLLAGGNAGTADDPIVTHGISALAARHGTGFHLTNREQGERLEISEIENYDAGTLGDDRSGGLIAGVRTLGVAGDTVIRNEAGGANATIVLGDLARPRVGEGSRHIASAGDLVLDAAKIEISNARFYVTTDEDGEDLVEASNNSRLTATGDIILMGPIDTAADSTAMDDREDPETPIPDEFVEAELILESTAGVTRFEGDVGATRALARLDTTDAVLPADRSFNAEEAVFRGSLNGPGSASVGYEGDAAMRVAFGGDVGTSGALGGLDVEAEQIDFTIVNANGSTSSANQVTVDGAISLDASPADGTPPTTATITDTQGGLRLQATGDIVVADLDKLAVTGDLSLTSATRVRVGDLSANSINVNAPTIEIVRRDPGNVELRDGSIADEMDAGTDFVANDIVLSSSPSFVGSGATPTFFLGSGGISLPGELNGIAVRRLDGRLSAVGPQSFAGEGGRVLDLSGSGPDLVADPTPHIPRVEPLDLPSGPPEMGDDAPAVAPLLAAPAVQAFLRCGGPGLGSVCASDDEDALRSLTASDRAGLATARALELTQRYRELVAAPSSAERLQTSFAAAGRAYAAATGWSEGDALDGAIFYRFLQISKQPALDSVHELSWLFTQIRLLGMSEGDTRRLQAGLAEEFAVAAGLPGFTGETAMAAVDASPIGLPPGRSARTR